MPIRRKGRPVTQCDGCRELRKTRQIHVKCQCKDNSIGMTSRINSACLRYPMETDTCTIDTPTWLHQLTNGCKKELKPVLGDKSIKTMVRISETWPCLRNSGLSWHRLINNYSIKYLILPYHISSLLRNANKHILYTYTVSVSVASLHDNDMSKSFWVQSCPTVGCTTHPNQFCFPEWIFNHFRQSIPMAYLPAFVV